MSASAHPPTPDAAASDPRKDSLIEYPSAFPIKVMGIKTEGFVAAMGDDTFGEERDYCERDERRPGSECGHDCDGCLWCRGGGRRWR